LSTGRACPSLGRVLAHIARHVFDGVALFDALFADERFAVSRLLFAIAAIRFLAAFAFEVAILTGATVARRALDVVGLLLARPTNREHVTRHRLVVFYKMKK
jgi:hypothetical protein